MREMSQKRTLQEVTNTVICGDVIDSLKTLPDESVNCVVTSPPYY
jgi:DNA modification methylase